MSGWFSIHRKIQENELWLAEPFTKGQAWVDLILLANHTQKVIFKRGIKVVLNRGEVGWSEQKLADRWQWSRGKVRRFLKYLKTVQQIEHQNSHTLSRIIILNYDKYQTNGTTDGTTDSTNDNNVNKVNNNISEQSSVKQDMSFKKYSEDFLEGDVDLDGDGSVTDPLEEEKKLKEAGKKHRAEMRRYVSGLRDGLNLPKLDAKQMNWQLKDYQILLDRGWTHQQIGQAFIHIATSDLWKDKMQDGVYPGMNTVEFSLRNKSPK